MGGLGRVRPLSIRENMVDYHPKWKLFEKDIHAIHAMFASEGTSVMYDERVIGFDSKVERQIDVSIRALVSDYPIFIAIECKDKNRPIDLVDMGAFTSLIKDVRANKGVMISPSGFTKAAIDLARSAGIDTQTFSKETHSVPAHLQTLTFTAQQTRVEWSVLCKHLGTPQLSLQPDHYMEVFSMEGARLGKMSDLIYEMGRRGNISIDSEASTWELPSPLLAEFDGHMRPVKLLVQFIVGKRFFIGTVAVEHVRIDSAQAEKNVHDFLRTGLVSLKPWDEVTEYWQEVQTLANLAIAPAFELIDNPKWD